MLRPIKNCYWVEPLRLLAGEYPRDLDDRFSLEKVRALLRSGVAAFIDLTEENEGLKPYSQMIEGATHHRFPIRDVSVPSSPAQTIAILDAIDSHIAREELVYVHCWGGVGRTGVIVGCWLARHGLEGPAALSRLRELWSLCPKSIYMESPQNRVQEEYILNWISGQ